MDVSEVRWGEEQEIETHLDDSRVERRWSIDTVQVTEETTGIAQRSSFGVSSPERGVLQIASRQSSLLCSSGRLGLTVVEQFKHLTDPSSVTSASLAAGLDPVANLDDTPS